MACCFSANEEQEAAPVKEGRKYPILASRGWSASNLLPHYLFLFVLTVGGDEPETALNAAHRLSPLSWEQWRNYFLVCVFLKSVMMYVHLGLGPPWVEYACAPCVCVGSLLRLPSTIQDMRWIGNSWPRVQMVVCFNMWPLISTADLRYTWLELQLVIFSTSTWPIAELLTQDWWISYLC